MMEARHLVLKTRFYALPAVCLLMTACQQSRGLVRLHDELRGEIRAGQTVEVELSVPDGYVAHALIHQHEINLTVESGGVSSDSTDWGHESIHLEGNEQNRVRVILHGAMHGSRVGRYQVRFLSLDRASEQTGQALKAQPIEHAGRVLLKERTRESLPLAAAKLKQAHELWKLSGDSLREAHALLGYGIAMEKQGVYGAADVAYVEANQMLAASGAKAAYISARKTWMNLGGQMGELRGTRAELNGMLEEFRVIGDRRGVALFTKSLGSAHARANDLPNAHKLNLEYLRMSRELGDRAMEGEALDKLSSLERGEGHYAKSLSYAQEALRIARELNDSGSESSALGRVAASFGFLNRRQEQIQILRRLVALHESRNDMGSWVASSELLADTFRQDGNVKEAWAIYAAMQPKLDGYYARIGDPGSMFVKPGESSSPNLMLRMMDRGNSYDRQGFWFADAQRARFFVGDSKDRLKKVQDLLPADTALVSYSTSRSAEDPGSVWVLSTEGLVRFRVKGSSGLGEEVQEVRGLLSGAKRGGTELQAKLKFLSDQILGPLRGKLGLKKLVIVPDEILAGIPFGILPDPDHADGSMLGDHHVVTYAPAAQMVGAWKTRERTNRGSELLIAGDPVTNLRDSRMRTKTASPPEPGDWTATARAAGLLIEGTQLPRLAFAGAEADGITAAIGAERVQRLSGFDASRSRVVEELKSARFAHLILHGFADLEKPKGSGLAFSFWDREGRPLDGILRFGEIAAMKLDAELVTLAACETALGKVVSYNGVPSLANAFLRAGARRVVSALWKVDDAATGELMAEFYKQLFAGAGVSPGEALWRAQMHVAKQARWSSPYYWAGFVLSGDWRPL